MKKIVSIAIILIALLALVSCEQKTTIRLLPFGGNEYIDVEYYEDECYSSLGTRINGDTVTVNSKLYVQYVINRSYFLMNSDHVVLGGDTVVGGNHEWTLTIDLRQLNGIDYDKYAYSSNETFADIATRIGGQISGNIIVNANDQNYMLSLSGSPNPVTKTTTVTAGDYVWAPMG